jgi:hypothetical protein
VSPRFGLTLAFWYLLAAAVLLGGFLVWRSGLLTGALPVMVDVGEMVGGAWPGLLL